MRSSTMAAMWILTAAAMLAGVARAQPVHGLSVQIGADELLSTSLPARPLVEPHLATNPTNPRHLVGAVMMSVRDQADVSQVRCVALASFDGARTWVKHEFSLTGCHDPWVAILDDGTAVFIGIEIINRSPVDLKLFRSPDGGRTWPTIPQSFGSNHDHPTLIVDRTAGKSHGALYVVTSHATRDAANMWQSRAFVARSMDGGRTFGQISEPEVMNVHYNTMTAVVLPNGALLVPLSAHHRLIGENNEVPLRNHLYWVIRSDDGGAHFGVPTLISDACTTGGFPSMAVDLSNGPRRGRTYAVCPDGLQSGPYVFQSDDGGNRWSNAVHVPKMAPVDAAGQRKVPSIAVNRDGIIAVSWHDRGPDASNKCWDLLVAFSGDGGETFTDAHKASTKPSCPATAENGWSAQRWSFGGDYTGLAAAADGTFHLLWSDSRGDRYELRTAQARVTR